MVRRQRAGCRGPALRCHRPRDVGRCIALDQVPRAEDAGVTPPAASLDLALRAAFVAALESPEGQAAIRAAVQTQVVPFQPRAPERMKVRRAANIADKCQDTIRRAIKAKELKASKAKGSREWIIEYVE